MIAIIVLWILLGIIAVIVILLHFSLTAHIDLDKKGFDLRVRYMFFDIYPRKPKKPKGEKSSKKSELPEDSFDDFKEFDDNIEESLPTVPTDEKPVEAAVEEFESEVQTEALTESEVTAEPEEEVPEVKSTDVQEEQEDVPATADKPEEIVVKQEKKSLAGKLFHKKDKGKKKSKPRTKKKKKSSKLDELKAKYKTVKPYIPMGWKYFRKLLKAVRFTDTKIVLDVGKEDAYDAAMLYGKVQAGLFNGIAMLAGIFTVKLKKADVNCVFNEKTFGYDVHTIVRVRPSTIIAIGFCMGVNFLKIYLSGRRKKKRAAKRRRKELAAKANEIKVTN